MKLPKEVREFFAEKGRIGGSSKSPAKQRASRENAKKYSTEAQRKAARADSNRKYYEKKKRKKEEANSGENLPLFKNVL